MTNAKNFTAPATVVVTDTLIISVAEKAALKKSIVSMGAGYKAMADVLKSLENGDNLFYPISKWVEVIGVELEDRAKNALKNALQFERAARLDAGYKAPDWYRGAAKKAAKSSDKLSGKAFTAPATAVDSLGVSVSIAHAWLSDLIVGSKVSPEALVSQLKRCDADFFVAVKSLMKTATAKGV